jgi:hypothetical protein
LSTRIQRIFEKILDGKIETFGKHTSGWQWPVFTTPMPAVKSRSFTPSTVYLRSVQLKTSENRMYDRVGEQR